MPAEAGTPVARQNGHRPDMLSQSRCLFEAMTRQGSSTQQQLQPEAERNRNRLAVELNLLQQQGLVLAISRDDGVNDRPMM